MATQPPPNTTNTCRNYRNTNNTCANLTIPNTNTLTRSILYSNPLNTWNNISTSPLILSFTSYPLWKSFSFSLPIICITMLIPLCINLCSKTFTILISLTKTFQVIIFIHFRFNLWIKSQLKILTNILD